MARNTVDMTGGDNTIMSLTGNDEEDEDKEEGE